MYAAPPIAKAKRRANVKKKTVLDSGAATVDASILVVP
jgi:hypothetical protein